MASTEPIERTTTAMRIIELSAAKWKTFHELCLDLLPQLGAPTRHGKNINALIDSMIWGGINAVDPPYRIRILGWGGLSEDLRADIETFANAVAKSRAEYQRVHGKDIEVEVEFIP